MRIHRSPRPVLLAGLVLAAAAALGPAQIKAYTLSEMVAETDGAIYGEIVGKSVFAVTLPEEDYEQYFTTLTLEGRSLLDGTSVTIDVIHHGGFIDEDHGLWNSEAPSADDTRVGNRVVVFHKWIGGDLPANYLMAMHGGLFRTADGGGEPVALGRGDGYAIANNVHVSDLEKAIRKVREVEEEQR